MPAPRLILICCEGKTEKAYFDIIKDVFRAPYYTDVEIIGEKGQHKALIDRTVIERTRLADKMEVDETDIVTWAVCDDDGMSLSYTKLLNYAERNSVNLAFSKPQFEAYLVQHFEQSKKTTREVLFATLTEHRNKYGGEGSYDDGTKADLRWLGNAISDSPKLAAIAITNSNQRTKQTQLPFLTVQHLTEYLLSIEI
jgi:hypothetical protein